MINSRRYKATRVNVIIRRATPFFPLPFHSASCIANGHVTDTLQGTEGKRLRFIETTKFQILYEEHFRYTFRYERANERTRLLLESTIAIKPFRKLEREPFRKLENELCYEH